MTDSSEARNIAPSETLALLYLAAPVGVFLVAAVIPALAWPATALLGYTLWRSGRHTAWRLHGPGLVASIAALGLSLGWVFASGNLGVLQANEDWSKHHALLNLLASKPWWPADDAGTLRYSLGWYLLPALAMKGVGGHGALFSALWSVLGLLLFCRLIAPIFSSCTRYLAGIVAFAVFAGGDLFGTLMTGYRSHIPFHLEWWSAWIQYSGTTTALFWTPQHALPAWIGIGLFMRQWAPMQPPQTTAPSPALVVALALFWSPFAALGLLPFAVLLLSQQWRRGWPIDGVGLIAALVIAVPLLVFLQTDTAEIPKAFIWNSRCVMSGGSCFSWSGLVFFLLVETGGAALVLWACRDRARQAFNLLAL